MNVLTIAPAPRLATSAAPGARLCRPPEDSRPGPVETFEPQPEAGRNRTWKLAIGAGLLLATGAALAGCAGGAVAQAQAVTSSVTQLARSDSGLTVELMPVEAGRVDLIRQTRTEQDDQGESVTVPVEYSPVGVNLGDGLFFDLNGNLSLLPERAFGEATTGDYSRVIFDPPGWSNETVIRLGQDTVRVDPPGWAPETVFDLNQNSVDVDLPGLGNHLRVTRSGNRTVIDPPGWANEITIVRGESQSTVDAPGWGNTITVRRQGNRLEIDPPGWSNTIVIQKSGSQITVDPPGWSDTTTIRIGNGSITYDPPGWSDQTTVRVTGQTTQVDPPGWRNTTVVHRE